MDFVERSEKLFVSITTENGFYCVNEFLKTYKKCLVIERFKPVTSVVPTKVRPHTYVLYKNVG